MLVQPTMASASASGADLPPRQASAAPAISSAGRQESRAFAAAAPVAPPSREALHAAVEASRKALAAQGTIEFRIDDSTGRTVVQVLDPATDEVLRQIPSEEMLAIASALDRVQGLLLRQQA